MQPRPRAETPSGESVPSVRWGRVMPPSNAFGGRAPGQARSSPRAVDHSSAGGQAAHVGSASDLSSVAGARGIEAANSIRVVLRVVAQGPAGLEALRLGAGHESLLAEMPAEAAKPVPVAD